MKWTAVATAPDQLTAEAWAELLRNSKVPAVIEAEMAVSFLGVSALPCRVMVPEDLVEKASSILKMSQDDFED